MWIKIQKSVSRNHPTMYEEIINLQEKKCESIKLERFNALDYVISGKEGNLCRIFGRYSSYDRADEIFHEILEAMVKNKNVYQMPEE